MEMSFEQFTTEVKDALHTRLTDADSEVVLTSNPKPNGEMRTGIAIHKKNADDIQVSPTLYLEEFYERYMDTEGNDRFICICNEIMEEYNKHTRMTVSDLSLNPSDLTFFDKVKAHLYLKAVNEESSREYLKGVPYKVVGGDIAVFVVVSFSNESCMSMTAKVSNEMLDKWQKDFDAVYTVAKVNTHCINRANGMLETMAEIQGVTVEQICEMLEIPMEAYMEMNKEVVLTNKYKMFGGACLADNVMLDIAREKLGVDKIIIIPSSIHELIAFPYDAMGIDAETAKSWITDVNLSEVPPEDILSYHAYIYDGNEVKAYIA